MEKNKRALAKRLEKERQAKEEADRMKKEHADSLRMLIDENLVLNFTIPTISLYLWTDLR